MAVAAYSFSWSAPSECPAESEVATEIARLLASGPAPSARVAARAVVRRDADGQWRVELTTSRDGEEGARTLVAPSCQSLADATALIVALTIDPARGANLGAGENNVGSGTPAPSASPAQPAPAPRAPESVPSATPEARYEAGQTWWAWEFAATGDAGRLAGPSVGGRLAGAWLAGSWRLEAYGFAWGLPTRSMPPSSSSLGANVEMFGGGAAACFSLRRGWIEIGPCLGPELGDVHGLGFGVETPQSQDRAWVAAAGSVRAAAHVAGPVFVSLEIGAVVPFVRDSFRLDGIASASNPFHPTSETVYSPGAVQGRAAIGIEVRTQR